MVPIKVLIVEDERISALNLSNQLQRLGYDVPKFVTSGAAALASIGAERPDIVLMDIHIEGSLDGIQTAAQIPAELMPAVVYLTAHSDETTITRAASTKPYGYLLKPFSEREPHATLQMALQRRSAELALRQSEADLRRSREDFRFLFENSPLPMWVTDRVTFRFLEANQAAVAAYGYSREEFLATDALAIRPPEDGQTFLALMAQDPEGYLEARNWRHRRKDGTIIEVDAFSHGLVFEGREARITAAIDVTARNVAEAKLRQAQKLEIVGQLTGGVAHDFNNLLAIIQGNLELAEERALGQPKVTGLIAEALKAAGRGAILTHRLLAYARQQPLDPRTIDPSALVSELRAMLQQTLTESVELECIEQPGLWLVHIDPHQLETVLLNLAVNARDAMPEGGKLIIECMNAVLDADYATLNADVTPGNYVLIAVTDTGVGMSAEVLQRAFEPFFTTKAVGRGTGLGLSMVFGFVKQSGGHVKIYSEPGRGTTVKIYLPRAAGSFIDQAPSDSRATAPLASDGQVVLVVEDDPAVRALTVTMLRDLGYEVLEAADGIEALSRIEATPHVDLLLTDVVLPKGLNGPALALEAERRVPGLKVLYMSGYTRDAIVRNGVMEQGVHLLMKPFRRTELAMKVKELLQA